MKKIIVFVGEKSLARHARFYLNPSQGLASLGPVPQALRLLNYTGFLPEHWKAFKALCNADPSNQVPFYHTHDCQLESKEEVIEESRCFPDGYFNDSPFQGLTNYDSNDPDAIKEVIFIHDGSQESLNIIKRYKSKRDQREYLDYPLPKIACDPEGSYGIKEEAREGFFFKILKKHFPAILNDQAWKEHRAELSKKQCYDNAMILEHLNAVLTEGIIINLSSQYSRLLQKVQKIQSKVAGRALLDEHPLNKKQKALCAIVGSLFSLLSPTYKKVILERSAWNHIPEESKTSFPGTPASCPLQQFIESYENILASEDFKGHLKVLSDNRDWAPYLANIVLNIILLPFVALEYLGRVLDKHPERKFGITFFETSSRKRFDALNERVREQRFALMEDSLQKRLEYLGLADPVEKLPQPTSRGNNFSPG